MRLISDYISLALLTAIVTAAFAAFIIIMTTKIGLRDYLINKTKGTLQQLLECEFCLGFWIAVIISVFLSINNKDISFMLIPFISAPITRFLV